MKPNVRTAGLGALALVVASGYYQLAGASAAAAAGDLVDAYTPFSHVSTDGLGHSVGHFFAAPTFSQLGGTWHRIDPTLHAVGASWAGETVMGPVTFGNSPDSLMQLAVPGGVLSVRASGLSIAAPAAQGRTITYANVAASTDLRYTVSASGVKEELRLRDATSATSFAFTIDDPGHVITDLTTLPNGDLQLVADQAWALQVPRPTVSDSVGDLLPASAVTAKYQRQSNGVGVSLSVDPGWLAQQTNFPLIVDPTLQFVSVAGQAAAKSAYFNTDPNVMGRQSLYDATMSMAVDRQVCTCALTGGVIARRSFLRFDLSTLPQGSVVDSADLHLWRRSGDTAYGSDFSVGTYAATSGHWLDSGTFADEVVGDVATSPEEAAAPPSAGAEHVGSLTALTASWVNDEATNFGVVLKHVDEATAVSRTLDWVAPSGSQGTDQSNTPELTVTLHADSSQVVTPASLASCITQTQGCGFGRYDDPSYDAGTGDNLDPPPGPALIPADSGSTDTSEYPALRTVRNGIGVTFRGLTGPKAGVSGVDLVLFNSALNQDATGRAQPYLPCKNLNDTYHAACKKPKSGSYYWADGTFVANGNPYPYGILLPNQNHIASCPNGCKHLWGDKARGFGVEFYMKNGTATDLDWVRPRFDSALEYSSTVSGNGYNMSPDWGSIPERNIGDSGVGRLSGHVYAAGGVAPAGAGNVYFSVFQTNQVATAQTSTGQYIGSMGVGSTVTGGVYTTGTVYAANFTIRVTDKTTGHVCTYRNRQLNSPNMTADFFLDRPYFGRGSTDTACNF